MNFHNWEVGFSFFLNLSSTAFLEDRASPATPLSWEGKRMQLLPYQLTQSHLDGTLFIVYSHFAVHPLDIPISLALCLQKVCSKLSFNPSKFWYLCYKVFICIDLNYATFQILCSQFYPLNRKKLDGERSNQGSTELSQTRDGDEEEVHRPDKVC